MKLVEACNLSPGDAATVVEAIDFAHFAQADKTVLLAELSKRISEDAADAVLADSALSRKKKQNYEHFTNFLPAEKWRQIAADPSLAFAIIMEFATLSLAQKPAAMIAICKMGAQGAKDCPKGELQSTYSAVKREIIS